MDLNTLITFNAFNDLDASSREEKGGYRDAIVEVSNDAGFWKTRSVKRRTLTTYLHKAIDALEDQDMTEHTRGYLAALLNLIQDFGMTKKERTNYWYLKEAELMVALG